MFNHKCQCECKNRHICEKDYVWNPSTCNYENGKYLASIMDNSAIMCDEVIESYYEETQTVPNTKFLYFTCIFINYCSIIDSCYY